MKEYHPGRYSYMLSSGKLYTHLLEIDEMAQNYLDATIPCMADAAGVTEALKAQDQIRWLGRMNAICD